MQPNLITYPARTAAAPARPLAVPAPRRYRTFAGTIAEGMDVIAPDGACLGRVARVEDNRIILAAMPESEGSEYLMPMNLVDGIASGRVLIAEPDTDSYGIPSSH